MTLKTEVQEKYILIDKLKKEISDLIETKRQVVRDINVPSLEAKEKADKIILEANTKAEGIIANANKAKAEAGSCINDAREEIKRMLEAANEETQKATVATECLDIEIVSFEKEKKFIIGEANQNKEDALALVATAEDLKKQAEDLQIILTNREAELNDKERSQNELEQKLNHLHADQFVKQGEIRQQSESLANEKQEFNHQEEISVALSEKVDAKFNEARNIEDKNKEDLEKIASEKKAIEEKAQNVNQQFVALEKCNKKLDDKEKSIDAKGKLLAIRDREVLEKIKILEQLRAKQ